MNRIEGKILLLHKILTFVVQIPFTTVKNEDINLVPKDKRSHISWGTIICRGTSAPLVNCGADAATEAASETIYRWFLFGFPPSRHYRHCGRHRNNLRHTAQSTLSTALNQKSIMTELQRQKLSVAPIFVSFRHRRDTHSSQWVKSANQSFLTAEWCHARLQK